MGWSTVKCGRVPLMSVSEFCVDDETCTFALRIPMDLLTVSCHGHTGLRTILNRCQGLRGIECIRTQRVGQESRASVVEFRFRPDAFHETRSPPWSIETGCQNRDADVSVRSPCGEALLPVVEEGEEEPVNKRARIGPLSQDFPWVCAEEMTQNVCRCFETAAKCQIQIRKSVDGLVQFRIVPSSDKHLNDTKHFFVTCSDLYGNETHRERIIQDIVCTGDISVLITTSENVPAACYVMRWSAPPSGVCAHDAAMRITLMARNTGRCFRGKAWASVGFDSVVRKVLRNVLGVHNLYADVTPSSARFYRRLGFRNLEEGGSTVCSSNVVAGHSPVHKEGKSAAVVEIIDTPPCSLGLSLWLPEDDAVATCDHFLRLESGCGLILLESKGERHLGIETRPLDLCRVSFASCDAWRVDQSSRVIATSRAMFRPTSVCLERLTGCRIRFLDNETASVWGLDAQGHEVVVCAKQAHSPFPDAGNEDDESTCDDTADTVVQSSVVITKVGGDGEIYGRRSNGHRDQECLLGFMAPPPWPQDPSKPQSQRATLSVSDLGCAVTHNGETRLVSGVDTDSLPRGDHSMTILDVCVHGRVSGFFTHERRRFQVTFTNPTLQGEYSQLSSVETGQHENGGCREELVRADVTLWWHAEHAASQKLTVEAAAPRNALDSYLADATGWSVGAEAEGWRLHHAQHGIVFFRVRAANGREVIRAAGRPHEDSLWCYVARKPSQIDCRDCRGSLAQLHGEGLIMDPLSTRNRFEIFVRPERRDHGVRPVFTVRALPNVERDLTKRVMLDTERRCLVSTPGLTGRILSHPVHTTAAERVSLDHAKHGRATFEASSMLMSDEASETFEGITLRSATAYSPLSESILIPLKLPLLWARTYRPSVGEDTDSNWNANRILATRPLQQRQAFTSSSFCGPNTAAEVVLRVLLEHADNARFISEASYLTPCHYHLPSELVQRILLWVLRKRSVHLAHGKNEVCDVRITRSSQQWKIRIPGCSVQNLAVVDG